MPLNTAILDPGLRLDPPSSIAGQARQLARKLQETKWHDGCKAAAGMMIARAKIGIELAWGQRIGG